MAHVIELPPLHFGTQKRASLLTLETSNVHRHGFQKDQSGKGTCPELTRVPESWKISLNLELADIVLRLEGRAPLLDIVLHKNRDVPTLEQHPVKQKPSANF